MEDDMHLNPWQSDSRSRTGSCPMYFMIYLHMQLQDKARANKDIWAIISKSGK